MGLHIRHLLCKLTSYSHRSFSPCSQLSAGVGITGTHPLMGTVLDDVISKMEALYADGDFGGDSDRLFTLVESFPRTRDLSAALEYKVYCLT